MKICILHRYPLSIIEGTNPSFHVFLEKALKLGHKIFLITYKNYENHYFKDKIDISDISISFRRQNAFEMLLRSLLFVLIAPLKTWWLNKKQKFDLIYCDDSFPLYDLFVKVLTGNNVLIRRGDLMCAYILDKFGFLARPLFKLAFFIEKYTWKKVDGISVITEVFKEYLLGYGINKNKIFVIEDSIDFEKFKNAEGGDAIKQKYNISNEFIVMYHGTLMKLKGLDTFIRAVPTVVSKYKSIKFFIIGDGEELKKLKRLAKELNIEDYVIFTGWIKYDDIQSYLNICDIGIPIRKNTLANNQIITTALLQYWASSKPVIAPKLTAISDVIQENINGFLFEPENPEDLALEIIKAISMRNSLEVMGKKGRDGAVEKYNVDTIAEKMCHFLNYPLDKTL